MVVHAFLALLVFLGHSAIPKEMSMQCEVVQEPPWPLWQLAHLPS